MNDVKFTVKSSPHEHVVVTNEGYHFYCHGRLVSFRKKVGLTYREIFKIESNDSSLTYSNPELLDESIILGVKMVAWGEDNIYVVIPDREHMILPIKPTNILEVY